jgi:N-formylglutamate deformylase
LSRVLDIIRNKARQVTQRQASDPQVRASTGSTALVFDSPHSGSRYPDDFDYACALHTLRRSEDAHVDELFSFAPALGVAWVEALFPRSYVDVNRNECEIDVTMIEGAWHGAVEADPARLSKVRLGKGLLWKLTDDGVPIYSRKLTASEVALRIDRCWRPYHAAVAQAIASAHARHGFCIHINCHSMPAVAASHATEYPGLAHADIVLGDRDGTTASPMLTSMLADSFRRFGYSVSVNHPYKGVELVRRYSDPSSGRHSIQLEINRKLYMDESTLALEPHSEQVRQHLQYLTRELLALRPTDLR